MPQHLIIEFIVELPDDLDDRGAAIAVTKPPYQDMGKVLEENGLKFQSRRELMDSRAKLPVAGPVVRRTRGPNKPKVAPPPHISLAPPEAAE